MADNDILERCRAFERQMLAWAKEVSRSFDAYLAPQIEALRRWIEEHSKCH